jgi:hypothetical protein
MLRMEMVIYMAPELGRPVKPWASANEDTVAKPLWSIVTSRSTGIWSDIIVTVGTIRGYTDVDADLSLGLRGVSREGDSRNSG